jgi:sacsin
MQIFENFQKAGIDVENVSPDVVIKFFMSHKEKASQCKIGILPAKLADTPLREIESVVLLLEYCTHCQEYKSRLNGLPLLVTNDFNLTTFDTQLLKYVTRHSKVAPHVKDLFVHDDIARVLRLQPEEDITLCKSFTINDFSQLLPDFLSPEEFCGSSKFVTITRLHDAICDLTDVKQWLDALWSFITSCIPVSVTFGHSTAITDVDRYLRPIADWCLLPVILVKEEVLVPLRYRLGVLPLTAEIPSELSKILQDIGVAYPMLCYLGNCSSLLNFFGDTKRPNCVISALQMVIQSQKQQQPFEKLDKRNGMKLLSYFSERINQLENNSTTKDILLQLPLYITIYDKQTPLNQSKIYVVPKDIQAEDMERWTDMLDVIFVKKDRNIDKLLKYLGCKILTVLQVYCQFIFNDFDKLSGNGRVAHLTYIRDYLENLNHHKLSAKTERDSKAEISELKRRLLTLSFLPSRSDTSVLVPASEYFDDNNIVFKSLLSNDMFPPAPYNSRDWKDFLRVCGLRMDVDEEMFMTHAQNVELQARQNMSETVYKQSEILLQHFLDNDSLRSSRFLECIKQVAFIKPHCISTKLAAMKPQFETKNLQGNMCFIAFHNSGLYRHWKLIWSSKNILPSTVTEAPLAYGLLNDGTSENRNTQFRNLMKKLSVTVDPEPFDVADHMKRLCLQMAVNNSEALKTRETAETIKDILGEIYQFLRNHCPLADATVVFLKDVPCILAPDCPCLIRPSQLVTNILDDQEIRPYLYKFPMNLGEFQDLFLQLGATNSASLSQYAEVLAAVHAGSEGRPLHPHETQAVVKAMTGFLCLLHRENSPNGSLPETLYFPSTSGKLHLSTDLVYIDKKCLQARLGDFNEPILIDLKECGLSEETEAENVLKKLPNVLQPKFLSAVVNEILDVSYEELPSQLISQVKSRLLDAHFKNGLERIVRTCIAGRGLTPEEIERKVTEVTAVLSKIHLVGKALIRTHLEYAGQQIRNSDDADEYFAQDLTENGEQIWKIYVRSDFAGSFDFYAFVAKGISRLAKGCLHSHLTELVMILECNIEQIDSILVKHGIKKLSDADKPFNMPLGSNVPRNKQCFFYPGLIFVQSGLGCSIGSG